MNTGSPPATPPVIIPSLIIERDDGLYQIGFDDSAPGPFESRHFAESVAAQCRASS